MTRLIDMTTEQRAALFRSIAETLDRSGGTLRALAGLRTEIAAAGRHLFRAGSR